MLSTDITAAACLLAIVPWCIMMKHHAKIRNSPYWLLAYIGSIFLVAGFGQAIVYFLAKFIG